MHIYFVRIKVIGTNSNCTALLIAAQMHVKKYARKKGDIMKKLAMMGLTIGLLAATGSQAKYPVLYFFVNKSEGTVKVHIPKTSRDCADPTECDIYHLGTVGGTCKDYDFELPPFSISQFRVPCTHLNVDMSVIVDQKVVRSERVQKEKEHHTYRLYIIDPKTANYKLSAWNDWKSTNKAWLRFNAALAQAKLQSNKPDLYDFTLTYTTDEEKEDLITDRR